MLKVEAGYESSDARDKKDYCSITRSADDDLNTENLDTSINIL
jgi:hypothetical protein